MPLPEILAAIDDEARERTASLLAEAEKRCHSVLAAADERAESERLRMASAKDAAAQLAAARIVNQAHLEADRALGATRERLYRIAVEEASRRLASLRESPRYDEVFHRLLVEAHDALPEAEAAAVDPRDGAVIRSTAQDLGLSLTVQHSLDTWGGVELSTGDGRTVRNTLESRLYKADRAFRRLAVTMCPELAAGS